MGRRLREGEIRPECGEHVVHQPALAIDVAGVLGGDPGDAERLGQVHQQISELGLVGAGLVPLNLDGQAVAEDLAPLGQAAKGVGPASGADEGGELPGGGAGERDQALAPLGDLAPADGGPAASGVGMLAAPGVEVAHAGAGDEAGEVPITALVDGEERGGIRGGPAGIAGRRGREIWRHQQLGTYDRPDALAPGLEHESDDPTQVRSVGETQALVTQDGGAAGQGLGGDGAVAEGEGGVGAEFCERSH